MRSKTTPESIREVHHRVKRQPGWVGGPGALPDFVKSPLPIADF